MGSRVKTDFDDRAADWDANPQRIAMADGVADAMIRELKPTSDMSVMDYGCGSGLITMRFQPLVKRIVGIDSSKRMLDVLRSKVEKSGLGNVVGQLADLEEEDGVEGSFDLIVSSMALHHVRRLPELLRRLHDHLVPGGRIGIADLDKEDGTFHRDNTGVAHFGFERDMLKGWFEGAGFHDARDVTATTVVRETEEHGSREYSIFLMTGTR